MREVQDHWFRLAKEEGYRSRAAYKLRQIDERKRILRRGARVLDAGAAPGSWSQVAAEAVGPSGEVVAIDLKAIEKANLPRNVKVLQGDLTEATLAELGGRPFDLLLSDMAPDTTGTPEGDHFRSVRLCDTLLDRAGEWLKPGGDLVMKVFEGGEYPNLLKKAAWLFREAKGYKPPSSRSESVEMFVVCHGFRGSRPPAPAAGDSILPKRKPSKGWGTTGE